MRPFVNGRDYLETERQVNLFEDGVGKELHEKLISRAKNSKNWVTFYSQLRYYASNQAWKGKACDCTAMLIGLGV